MDSARYQRLKLIFHEVCELPEPERAARLDAACGDDVELRDDVEALIADFDGVVKEDRFDESKLGIGFDLLARVGVQAEDGALELPKKIGRYRIIRQIGQGGMGTVFEAEQDNPRRTVALKMIRPGSMSAVHLRRFRREVQTLGLLHHPGIAQIYEAGTTKVETESGLTIEQPFFAMELIHGQRLEDHTKAEAVNVRERLALFADICDAVQHAHQKGVIHRDLKPGNILIQSDGKPKILDFGIARLTGTDVHTVSMQTNSGEIIGTLAYMSPEQVTGDPTLLDTRSDIYSLGVILFELLTGRLPLDVRTRTIPEAIRMIQEDEPLRVGLINPECRGDVATIVAKALEKESKRRYQSAAELGADVRRYLADEPVVARAATATYLLRKFAKRNKGLVIAAGSTAVALILGLGLATYGFMQASRERDRALQAEVEAKAQRDLAEMERTEAQRQSLIASAINTFLNDELLGASDPEKTPDRNITVREVLDTASRTIAGSFGDQPVVEASIRTTLGNTYTRLGEFDSAEPHLQRALEIQRAELGEEHRLSMNSVATLGSLRSSQGHLDQAALLLDEAIAIQRRVLGDDDPDTLRSMALRAKLFAEQGRNKEAEELLLPTLERQRRVMGETHQDTLNTMQSLASFYWRNRRLDEAEPLYAKVAAVRRETLGEEHPKTLVSNNSLALIYGERGRLEEAERIFVENTRVLRRVLGDEHRDTLKSLNNLADLYKTQGRFDEAISIQEELTETRRRVLGTEHPDTLKGKNNLAIMYFRKDRFKDAEKLYLEILPIRQRVLGDEHPDTLITMNSLALLYNKQHRFDESEALQLETIGIQERTLGENHSDVLISMYNLAGLYNEQKQFAKAEPLLATVVLRAKASLPLGHWHIGVFMYLHGFILKQLGRYDEAEPPLLEAHGVLTKGLGPTHSRTITTIKVLGDLYDKWGKPEEARTWRERLPKDNKAGTNKGARRSTEGEP